MAGAASVVAALVVGAATSAGGSATAAQTFLRTNFAITDEDLAHLNAGRVVSRTLPSSDSREVATLGVIRMAVTPAFYISRLADIIGFKRDEAVLQIGTFSDPPVVGDMAAMALDESDTRSLRNCRVGDCGIQLPAAAIQRFQSEVNWQAPDAAQQANALVRHVLVAYAAEYLKHGGAASMKYADVSPETDMGHEFATLVEPPGPGLNQFPGLIQHLLTYPAGVSRDITDRLYWSKELVRSRGVVSITHLSVAHLPEDAVPEYAVASKQIYASHYFDASLGLTVLVPDRSGKTPATYVVYLNRSRIDLFNGFFGGITRAIVKGKARGTVTLLLERLKKAADRVEPGGALLSVTRKPRQISA
jgi:hypothetical protein